MGSMRTTWALVIVLCSVGIASLWASGAGESADAAPPQELVFGLSGSPDTLDPHATTGTLTFQTMRSVYDTLVEPDRHGEIVPALARAWESREDGRVWEFELRRGVMFHHGVELTGDDVVASLNRLRDEEFGSPSSHEYSMIESVEAPAADRVVITLSEPHAPFLATLASGWSAILPKDLIDSGHAFGSEPVGTGPFRFVRWVRDNELVLDRNDQYWQDGRPLLERVEFVTITEQSVMAQALQAGQIDVADLVVEPELSTLRDAANVQIYEGTSALVMVLAINTQREPLDELPVRRGINAAIDKQAIMDNAYAGGVEVATFMDVDNPYYRDFTDLYEYDREYAAEIAEQTEFEDELVISVPQNYEPHIRAGELYHEMLRQAGFPVRLQLVEWSTWISDIYGDSQFDLTVIGHTGKLDPHGRLARYGTEETYVQWEDEAAATAIEEARRETDSEERAELYETALRRMAEELPFVFVGTPYRYVGLDHRIEGFHMDSQLDTFDLREVRFRQ
ncbi:MAG: ABC transporter substrate-binding protein [Alkalispirochaeta sp.]